MEAQLVTLSDEQCKHLRRKFVEYLFGTITSQALNSKLFCFCAGAVMVVYTVRCLSSSRGLRWNRSAQLLYLYSTDFKNECPTVICCSSSSGGLRGNRSAQPVCVWKRIGAWTV